MRILSLHPAATEILFAIGAGGMIVGRTDACDYPDGAKSIPSIGNAEEITPDRAMVFEPDVVLTSFGQEELSGKLMASCKVARFIPNSLEGLFSGIVGLGALVGKQVEADVVVHELKSAIERATLKSAKFHAVRVYCETHTPPLFGPGYVNEIVLACGGEPFTGDATVEKIAEFNPHMVIACYPGAPANAEVLCARDGWSALAAVQNDRVFVLDGALLHRPGPRLAHGIKKLAKLLHGVDIVCEA